MANTGFKGIDVRQTGTALVFRAFMQTSAGAKETTGPVVVSLYELQSDGTLKSYDFADNTFKTTALTTATLALTHRQGNNSTVNTGIWSAALATLTGFTVGGIYFAQFNDTLASPTDQTREFQYGGAEGDLAVTSGATGVAYLQDDVTRWATGTPNALQSGRVDSYVGATAASLTFNLTGNITGSLSGAVVLPTIPTNWIAGAGVAADAVTKIQAGLSTYAGADTAGTGTLLARLTSTRAGYLDVLQYLPSIAAGAAGGVFISGANAGPLSVSGGTTLTNAAGDGLTCSSTGGNGNGLNALGNGTGAGFNAFGGSTSGPGIKSSGGLTNGYGLLCVSHGTGQDFGANLVAGNFSAGCITDAAFAVPADTAGPATGILGKISQLWAKQFGKSVYDKLNGIIRTYLSNGSVRTTQTATTSTNTDEQDAAV